MDLFKEVVIGSKTKTKWFAIPLLGLLMVFTFQGMEKGCEAIWIEMEGEGTSPLLSFSWERKLIKIGFEFHFDWNKT